MLVLVQKRNHIKYYSLHHSMNFFGFIVISLITIADAAPLKFDCYACLKDGGNELDWSNDANSVECKGCRSGYYNNGKNLVCLKSGEDTELIAGGADICDRIPLEVYQRFFNTRKVSENQKHLLNFLEEMKIETAEELQEQLKETTADEKKTLLLNTLETLQQLIELLKKGAMDRTAISENQTLCHNVSEDLKQIKEQLKESEKRQTVATEEIKQIREMMEQAEKKLETAPTDDQNNCPNVSEEVKQIKEIMKEALKKSDINQGFIIGGVAVAVVVLVVVLVGCCRKQVKKIWKQSKPTCRATSYTGNPVYAVEEESKDHPSTNPPHFENIHGINMVSFPTYPDSRATANGNGDNDDHSGNAEHDSLLGKDHIDDKQRFNKTGIKPLKKNDADDDGNIPGNSDPDVSINIPETSAD